MRHASYAVQSTSIRALCLAAAAVAGCSSSSSPPGAATPAADAAATLPAGTTTVSYTMSDTIAAGDEQFSCQYVTAPADAAGFVVGGSHVYTVGSHHMILYRTDLTAIPDGQSGVQDCYEGPNGSLMNHIRGIIYAAQTPTGEQTYPAAVGLPYQAGEVFMMQTHYLNAGAASLDAKVDVTLDVSDGTGITTRAGVLFFYDPFIDVPPASTSARAQMRCLIPNDITLISAASHFHARGDDYAAYLDPPSGPLATTPFYTSNDWNHPATLSAITPIAAGNRIRFSCGYQNTDPTKEYFQGQSATDNEMCMFIGIYYPEMGTQPDFCMQDPDMFGTGTQTCSASLSCIQACEKNGAPPLAVGGGGDADAGSTLIQQAAVDPCYQKCFVSSCGDATAKLYALNACTRASCASACVTAGSTACASCVITNCATEYQTCSSDACD